MSKPKLKTVESQIARIGKGTNVDYIYIDCSIPWYAWNQGKEYSYDGADILYLNIIHKGELTAVKSESLSETDDSSYIWRVMKSLVQHYLDIPSRLSEGYVNIEFDIDLILSTCHLFCTYNIGSSTTKRFDGFVVENPKNVLKCTVNDRKTIDNMIKTDTPDNIRMAILSMKSLGYSYAEIISRFDFYGDYNGNPWK